MLASASLRSFARRLARGRFIIISPFQSHRRAQRDDIRGGYYPCSSCSHFCAAYYVPRSAISAIECARRAATGPMHERAREEHVFARHFRGGAGANLSSAARDAHTNSKQHTFRVRAVTKQITAMIGMNRNE